MGFIGDIIGAGGSDQAAQTQLDAANRWDEFEVPTAEEEAQRAYEMYQQGFLTPEQYSAVMQDPSSLESYSTDPRLRDAQMSSLDYLQTVGKEGGLTAEDRARQNAINNRNATEARGAREANSQRMAARGGGGSGMEAVQSMIANQGAATANYMGGTEVAANAERRALDAMTRSGQMAGSMRGQDFGEAERKAQAADRINQFNTNNQNRAGMYNTGNNNQARRDARSAVGNEWDRKKDKLQGWTGAYTGQAPYQEEAGKRYGEGVGGMFDWGAGTAGGMMMSDENAKDNIQPAEGDIQEFLDELTPQKWDYKDPQHGPTEGQENYGVMAQDMEKSDIGKKFVSEDAEGVKRIDYGSAQSTMLAILKSLSDRMDRLDKEGDSSGA